MNETTASIIRAVLKVGGGFLVARGLATETVMVDVAGAVVTLIGFVWGIVAAKKAAAASTPPPAV